MKRGSTDHPKMKRLARLLGISTPHAAGLMAFIWDRASNYAPNGNLSEAMSHEELAAELEWDDADQLVDALVRSRWVDRDESGALVIHDWPHHCEDSVHIRVARSKRLFHDGTRPRTSRLSIKERESIDKALDEAACARRAHGERTDVYTAYAYADAYADASSPERTVCAQEEAGEGPGTVHFRLLSPPWKYVSADKATGIIRATGLTPEDLDDWETFAEESENGYASARANLPHYRNPKDIPESERPKAKRGSSNAAIAADEWESELQEQEAAAS